MSWRLLRAWRPGLLVMVALLTGCASQGALLDRVDDDVQRGQTERALESLEGLSGSRRNQSLYWLNRGMLLRTQGDLDGSIAAFERAKDVIGELQPLSVSETVAAWAVAEDSGAYVPPTHEHLLLHVYQALNFLQRGDLDAARVEALQIDLGLRRIDPVDGRAPRGGDAFPRYLSGIIFEAAGDWSDALIAYRKALQAYDRQETAIPRDLQTSLVRFTDYQDLVDERDGYLQRFGIEAWEPLDRDRREATLVVVLHDGQAPRLREEGLVLPHPSENRLLRVSLPALERRPSPLTGARLRAVGREVEADLADDVAGSADRWLASLLPGITARVVSRNVARDVATRRLEQENELLALVLNVAGTIVDNADVRSWRSLPDRLLVSRLTVPAGSIDWQLEVLGRGSGVIDVLDGTVDLRPGETRVLGAHWINRFIPGSAGSQARSVRQTFPQDPLEIHQMPGVGAEIGLADAGAGTDLNAAAGWRRLDLNAEIVPEAE